MAMEQLGEALALMNNDGFFTYVNTAFARLHAAAPVELLAQKFTRLSADPDLSTLVRGLLRGAAEDGVGRAETQQRRLDGSTFHAAVSMSPLQGDAGELIGQIMLVSDITERKNADVDRLHQAYVDPLTGLPNRRLLIDRIEQALSRAERAGAQVGLLFLDLDALKSVNDQHGHAAGDLTLQEAARRFRGAVRSADTVARLAGDEFVVLLDSTAPEGAVEVAARVQAALSHPVVLPDATVHLSASVGVHLASGGSASDLLEAADQAMYHAKRSGRGRTKTSAEIAGSGR